MIFSYNWLKDYIVGKLPSAKKLAEVLTMHSFEVEELRKVGRDFVLDIDVLPNRACDCLSHIGVAREIAAICNLNLKLKGLTKIARARKVRSRKQNEQEDGVAVEVADRGRCSRYTAQVILGVKVKPSPKWLQERLKICGIQPINNIVDITNYVMLETGQPVHAFDFDKIKSVQNKKSKIKNQKYHEGQAYGTGKSKIKKIIVRKAEGGEKIKTLDGKVCQLDKDILVIADEKGPIALAGIKGGERTGVDKKTKNVIVEAANFDRLTVRKGAQKLGLRTDASWRFENGLDPNLIDFAQQKVLQLIQEIAGGEIGQRLVDFYPKKVRPKKINLDLDYLDSLLGLKIPKAKVLKILKSLGFQCKEARPRYIEVRVPTSRMDVAIPEDLIEEVGRIYSFQKIPEIFPRSALIPPSRNIERWWTNNCRDILKELGYGEVYNYSFLGEKESDIFSLSKSDLLEVENPVSSLNKYLRPSLIPSLLKNVKENLKFFDEIKIFELGKAFGKVQGSEKKMLAGVLARKEGGEDSFYELKGVIEAFLAKLGISHLWYDEYQPTPEDSNKKVWHAKRCAEIKSDGEEIGFLGEIAAKIVDKLAIKERVFVFEFDFEKLLKLVSEEHEYQPISAYPAAVRDLAILVPQGTKVVEVLNVINAAGGRLVRDVDLFDIYQGEEIPTSKQNLAFHIIYQAEDRTLSSKEIDRVHQKITKALEQNPSWEVRR